MADPSAQSRLHAFPRRLLGLFVVVGIGAGAVLVATDWRDAVGVLREVVVPEPLRPSSVPSQPEEPQSWDQPGLDYSDMAPVPFFKLLSYREGIAAGLTWIYGLPCRPLDPSDRRLGDTWEITLPRTATGASASPPTTFQLVVESERPEDPFTANITAGSRSRSLRVLQRTTDTPRLDGGADLALDQLGSILEALGAQGATARRSAPGRLPGDFIPGGITQMAAALAPLDTAGARATPEQLARAGWALAWEALLDQKLAPAVAPLRAAQALALVSVADRLAGTPLPESRAVRWLAPAAADGDYWMMAGSQPPEGWPQLALLHRAITEVGFPDRRPATFGVPEFLAYAERARAAWITPAMDRILDWSDTPELHAVARPFAATCFTWGHIGRTGGLAVANPLMEVETIARRQGWSLPDEAARAAARWGRDGAGLPAAANQEPGPLAENLSPWAHLAERESLALAVSGARALIDTAAHTAQFARRIVLEEAGERVLHGLCTVHDALSWSGQWSQLDVLGAALKEHRSWRHPQLAWLLTAKSLKKLNSNTAMGDLRLTIRAAAQYMPDLTGELLWDDQESHLGDFRHWPTGQLQLLHWTEYPRQVFRCLQDAGESSSRGIAAGLLEWLLKTQGAQRLWYYNLALDSFSERSRRKVLSLAPKAWDTVPKIAQSNARVHCFTGRWDLACRTRESALTAHPTNESLAEDLALGLIAIGKTQDAIRVAQKYLESGASDENCENLSAALAFGLRGVGAIDAALGWASRAASHDATRGLLELARCCAVTHRLDEAHRALDRCASRNPKKPELARMRCILDLLETQGKKGWSELASLDAHFDRDELMNDASLLTQAKAPLEGAPFGRIMSGYATLRAIWIKAGMGQDAIADLLALARRPWPDKSASWEGLHAAIQDLVPTVVANALRVALPQRRAPANLPDVLAILDSFRLADLGRVLFAFDAGDQGHAQLTKAAETLGAFLSPKEFHCLNLIQADPDGLEQWLSACMDSTNTLWELRQYVQYAYIQGEDDRVRRLVAAMSRIEGSQDILYPLLQFLTDSDGDLARWLKLHPVEGLDLQPSDEASVDWERRGRTLLARFRPHQDPGSLFGR